ncbi:MAG: cell division protein ZipA C-terminal FtsZ-binding domain-containing protein [Casimicrobiaceae bacterium]|nr:cell division protein ZipA C-terminal FtsZ-binding domain-containing protein [Casimicrobiaceae bacterium]MCX8098245.1 cell division protein ZipA C-terminal FtsZ-binding domain-containing protein [Casimicrobiaceae bacterium]MDW8311271.1 cell division protein ZipA C-terminal FtsZ-binding domain-containing protein [Burkholderiales bacterium]
MLDSVQLGLIGIGALLIALLALGLWWQTWRASRQQPRSPRGQVTESLSHRPETAGGERIEPTVTVGEEGPFDPPRRDAAAAPAPAHARGAASVYGHASAGEAPQALRDASRNASSGSRRLELPFDVRLHVYASIVCAEGGPLDARPVVHAAGRARAWVRLFRQSPIEPFDPEQMASVQQLILALPLASRAGPLTQADLDGWQYVVQEAARAVNGEVQFHGFADAAERAAELDRFLAAVDITPHIYLVRRDESGWAGTRLRSTLEANGFRLQSDGRFAYHEVETDHVIFHAVDGFERAFTPERLRTETIRALRFVFQPVNLTQPLPRFDVFRQTLRALAKLLDGELRSTDGSRIDDAAFAQLREEIKQAMDALAQAGIEPGSETAHALFA